MKKFFALSLLSLSLAACATTAEDPADVTRTATPAVACVDTTDIDTCPPAAAEPGTVAKAGQAVCQGH